MGEYILQCPVCKATVPDQYTNECPNGCFGLLQPQYQEKRFVIQKKHAGMFRFTDWLCCHGTVLTDAGPVTYRSENLGPELGLSNLYICFSGYWPERQANLVTCSFKELEALPTMQRRLECTNSILLVASAGNTGRAFAQVSAYSGIPVIITVPSSAVASIWTTKETDNVFLVTVDGDYSDAIAAGNRICEMEGVIPEGGAKNPARRDGMGTAMLDAVSVIGSLPDWYFQAVGSGTGGIAAWEMAQRLIRDGRFGTTLPRLYLSQNIPFIPMVSAYHAGRREIIPDTDMPDAENATGKVSAPVLTNRNPPYSICGGVFDALSATRGKMNAITNDEAKKAGAYFTRHEGIDLDPAAAVCVASLMQAVRAGEADRDETILLHITGGGYQRVREDYHLLPVEPGAHIGKEESVKQVCTQIRQWMDAR
ncbi:MAG: cysteate synthase [Methanospirillaceae archaeon]|nr:cysteate synthase [Methanospirillaceae archaeon]